MSRTNNAISVVMTGHRRREARRRSPESARRRGPDFNGAALAAAGAVAVLVACARPVRVPVRGEPWSTSMTGLADHAALASAGAVAATRANPLSSLAGTLPNG